MSDVKFYYRHNLEWYVSYREETAYPYVIAIPPFLRNDAEIKEIISFLRSVGVMGRYQKKNQYIPLSQEDFNILTLILPSVGEGNLRRELLDERFITLRIKEVRIIDA